ncbi:MAG TPA: hypothetical protein VIH08_10255 [Blastococcus sp.]
MSDFVNSRCSASICAAKSKAASTVAPRSDNRAFGTPAAAPVVKERAACSHAWTAAANTS